VLHLATSTNKEGYSLALQRTWVAQGKNMYQTPVKSSLSAVRNKVSYKFFSDIYQEGLAGFKRSRRTFKGFYVYSIDGSDLDLPASEDVLKSGYRGVGCTKDSETHYPKMQVGHAYDVLNGLVCGFNFSSKMSEMAVTSDFAENFERKSIAIYDRYYCGYPVFKRHMNAGNYFLVRTQTTGQNVPSCLRDFLKSARSDQEVTWRTKKRWKASNLKLRLIKVRHPRTKEISVFITNVSQRIFSRLELERLYLKRWEIETSFKDLVDTLKMDQWHSQNVNGILQEIFCLLWATNAIKMQVYSHCDEDILKETYRKPNFKLCMELLIRYVDLLVRNKVSRFADLLDLWLRRTSETRKRRSRSYPRAVKRYGTGFSTNSQVPRRPKCA
jgi:hypothetical protein